ncbi:hypothetical protein DKW60_14985 [Leucothrix pacifica]|uniref:Uncharacterized protein n=1 Tax=Leucothrix pacifica TaxID=1247513 RepID=A0A317CDG3_9GAMM|nr:hypothetical protein DKW60_14985 [Leucothrix pacifica]
MDSRAKEDFQPCFDIVAVNGSSKTAITDGIPTYKIAAPEISERSIKCMAIDTTIMMQNKINREGLIALGDFWSGIDSWFAGF